MPAHTLSELLRVLQETVTQQKEAEQSLDKASLAGDLEAIESTSRQVVRLRMLADTLTEQAVVAVCQMKVLAETPGSFTELALARPKRAGLGSGQESWGLSYALARPL